MTAVIRAVFFDFGGVISTSPFDAFTAYERRSGLPEGFIRRVNATNSDLNAWARLERSDISLEAFASAFEAEARALGHTVDGSEVLACLAGTIRPEMVEAVRRCRERLCTVLVTNNFVTGPSPQTGDETPHHGAVLEHFDVVVESSRVGVRKPERRFYEIACERAGVEPHEVVMLDDLGVNLKPARAMGMTSIKVADPAAALVELADVVGFAVA